MDASSATIRAQARRGPCSTSSIFPNGVCMARDGQSFFFAESWTCPIKRYWFDGPKKGSVETVIDNLPGYPDNINRASDGRYLGRAAGNAHACARPRSHDAGLPPPHGQTRRARALALSQHQHRLRHQVRRGRTGRREPMGPGREQSSDDHLDARAQRLSLSRRRLQQSHRSLQASQRQPELGRARRILGTSDDCGALKRAYAAFRGFDDER